MRAWWIGAGAAVVAAVAVFSGHAGDGSSSSVATSSDALTSASAQPPPAAPASRTPVRGREAFVGSAACASCHRSQSAAFAGSHHDRALVAPTPEFAKERFGAGRFASKLGGTTTFAVREGSPVVTTPMPGGETATLPIAYVSGVWPLEQYVVRTERGKLQSLGVVWDSRAAAQARNKWFHVYGASGIAPNDPLFFTSSAQNWNHVCADCHSTFVERRYDAATDSFDTRWAELSVGCEACHGPGAEHVRTAQAGKPAALSVTLKRPEPWGPSATGSPTPRRQDGAEVEVCAPCHSRRTPIHEGFVAGDPFLDSFEPELLEPGRYHADGQVEGEVYEWASFRQSRMYHAGVRCSDCHEPHSGKLFAEGNALCVRCHEPARFNVEAHSHHAGEKAPRCIDCHMPPGTFMQIDERRDHSIRVPRPDRSVALGTPNACNGCHAKESAAWARDALAKWYPLLTERPQFGEALAKDREGSLEAPRALCALAGDASAPAVARATALERLGHYPAEKTLAALRTGLASPDALVAYGAVLGAAELPLAERVPLLLAALDHRVRAVRVAAARGLASVRATELPPNARAALERGFTEVEASFAVSASQPETQVELSAFELARGRFDASEAALEQALRLRPCLAEAHLNLADLRRQRGDEPGAERAIRAALACSPESAAAHHALGLWQVRAHQTSAALTSLRKAAELAPNDARYHYVLAVALAGNGERDAAIRILQATLEHRPNDANALQALAGYLREAGQLEQAAEVRQKLETLLRD